MLGLRRSDCVSTYLKCYEDFPGAVYQDGTGRTRLSLKGEVDRWAKWRRMWR